MNPDRYGLAIKSSEFEYLSMDESLSPETEPPAFPKADSQHVERIASVVDCRDQLCPKPILMVKRALGETTLDQVLEIIVNEDVSRQNVLKYCWNHGQQVLRSYERGADFHVVVKKSSDKKVETPLPVVGPCGTRWD